MMEETNVSDNIKKMTSNRTFGWLMIGAGVLFVLANLFGGPGFLARALWPLWVVGAGAGIFVMMVVFGKRWGWLAVPASVTVTTGLLLFYANLFNHWISWVYSWTLLVAAGGLGILISHYWSGKPRNIAFGSAVVKISLVAFAAGMLLVEVVIGVGRRTAMNGLLWPLLLVALGGYLIMRSRDSKPALKDHPVIEASAGNNDVAFEPLRTEVGQEKEKAR